MMSINAIDLQKRMQEEDLFLLDVREPHEHEAFHIGGTLIPLDDLHLHIAEIPTNKPVIVYCKKGIRSWIAIQKLERTAGFTNLINLNGGMDAWQKIFKQGNNI